ncbi:MAG: hypothetical protein WKG01_09435 [Kofleriaceae bacterium]
MAELASCPKCNTPRAGELACPKCGLMAERMESFAADKKQAHPFRESGAIKPEAPPDALVAAWDRTILHWEEPVHHDELLRLVTQHDAYAWVAECYRTRGGDPISVRQLERVRRAAEVTLLATATPRAEERAKPYRAATAVLVMLIVAAVVGLLFAMLRGGGVAPTNGTVTPAKPLKIVAPPAHGSGKP